MIAPEEWTRILPVKDLRESPLNPRVTFSEEGLRQLAESLAGTHGQLQPLIIRPLGENPRWVAKRKEWEGVDAWEVVDGHRRLRAAKLAGLKELKCTARLLDDASTLSAMLVSNAQREDVPASEQAAAVRDLAEQVGQEEAARQVGWPLARVRDLLRLASLPAWFLAAVDAGEVSLSAAAIVGRIPAEANRTTAAVCVLTGCAYPDSLDDEDLPACEKGEAAGVREFRGDPVLSVKDTKELVKRFQRELKGAPFRKALDLVDGVPPCGECPKMAGNAAKVDDSYADVRADTCLDPECFSAKQQAWGKLTVAKAEKKGRTVLPAEVAAGLFYTNGRLKHYGSGYIEPDEVCHEDRNQDQARTYGELLKGHVEPVVAVGPDGRAHDLYPADAARKALKEHHGIGVREAKGGEDSKKREAEIRRKQEDGRAAAAKAMELVAHKAGAKVEASGLVPLLAQVARAVVDNAGADACRMVAKRRGLKYDPVATRRVVEDLALTLPGVPELLGLMAEACAARLAHYWGHPYGGNHVSEDERLFWKAFGVDKAALLKAAAAERKEREAAKGKGGKKVKAAKPAKAGPACRVCGCTEADCRQCIARTGEPCAWAEPGLCTACVGADVRTPPAKGPKKPKVTANGRAGVQSGGDPSEWHDLLAPAEGLLRDVKGFPEAVAEALDRKGVRTVAKLLELAAPDAGTPRADLFAFLQGLPGVGKGPAATAADAIVDRDVLPAGIDEPAPGPVVCRPLGELMLAGIDGLTHDDVQCLSAVGVRTLGDLERKCEQLPTIDRAQDVGHQIGQVLDRFRGAFTYEDVDRIVAAVLAHLTLAKPQALAASPSLATVKGLGKVYLEALAGCGLRSLADVAEACEQVRRAKRLPATPVDPKIDSGIYSHLRDKLGDHPKLVAMVDGIGDALIDHVAREEAEREQLGQAACPVPKRKGGKKAKAVA